jgi:hypothetical protein
MDILRNEDKKLSFTTTKGNQTVSLHATMINDILVNGDKNQAYDNYKYIATVVH